MATYDKSKLRNLLEQRRTAGLVVRDLAERERDARQETARLRSIIMQSASSNTKRHGRLDELLALSGSDAARMPAAAVAEYTFDGKVYFSNVEPATFQCFVSFREKTMRLAEERQTAQDDFNARFAIVPHLVDFVKSHGFADPEMEAI